MKMLRLTSFSHNSGHCWIAHLPAGLAPGDTEGAPMYSRLRLFEAGQELAPAHAIHSFIREAGRGSYSHWGAQLYFSTSDNTDPARNGREYWVVAPASAGENSRPEPVAGDGAGTAFGVPSNYAWQETGADKIRADADYALQIARGYLNQLPGGAAFLKGKSVLELGPGWSFATSMILGAWGARGVAVADRFLARYQPAYHTALYREIVSRLKGEAADTSGFERCIRAEKHDSSVIASLECPLEEISNASEGPFDIVLSNAVLEHVFNPLQAVKSVYAVMAKAGIALHQVDFRDHRDFARPLEYLLLDEFSFGEMFHAQHGECGNRIRPHQLKAMFALAGIDEMTFTANLWAENAYLADLEPRLRAARASPYSDIDVSLLREISGQFVLRKA